MSLFSHLNIIRSIQHWIDTRAGQTFMQYAYSWGAAVVILGTLFKLTHLPGANVMLFVGMGTEVFVFFVSGFERPFDRIKDEEKVAEQAEPVSIDITDSSLADALAETREEATPEMVVTPEIETPQPQVAPEEVVAATTDHAAYQPQPQTVVSVMPAIQATDPTEVQEAVEKYTDELHELTDVINKVRTQLDRMTTDSEEMENLNRTLTGISTVYELQLKTVSKQVVTIEQIDEQTRRMAQQIEELNTIYSRMIQALTVNAGAAIQG